MYTSKIQSLTSCCLYIRRESIILLCSYQFNHSRYTGSGRNESQGNICRGSSAYTGFARIVRSCQEDKAQKRGRKHCVFKGSEIDKSLALQEMGILMAPDKGNAMDIKKNKNMLNREHITLCLGPSTGISALSELPTLLHSFSDDE